MKTIIIQVLKEQKHVIKFLILTLVFTSTTYIHSQDKLKKEDYYMVNNVIDSFRGDKNSPIYMVENNTTSNSKLKKYYEYKYKDSLHIKSVISIDKDSIILAPKEEIVKLTKSLNARYDKLDEVFDKIDIENILKNDYKIKWDSKNLKNVILINENNIKNYNPIHVINIARPIYSKNKKYAIVHFSSDSISKLFIFKKVKEKWIEESKIINY